MHLPSNHADLLEVAEDSLLAIDVRFEDFPVVDSGLAWRSCVHQNKARFDVFGRYGNRLPVNAVYIEMNRVHATVKRGVIILTSGRNFD